jgi:hypothetical protein
MSNARAYTPIKVAIFWLDARVAVIKNEVLSELEYKTRLSGHKPLSSNINTEVGVMDKLASQTKPQQQIETSSIVARQNSGVLEA